MPKYRVAHIREQGIDLVIIPLEDAFGLKTENEQQEIIAELQLHATGAGLAGTVVPIWRAAGGRMGFIAPQNWHPFFRSLNRLAVEAMLNKEIFW